MFMMFIHSEVTSKIGVLIIIDDNISIFSGDLENEDEILEWLVGQLEKDEIEDVTDEMLDKLIKDGKTIAVLFCKYYLNTAISWKLTNLGGLGHKYSMEIIHRIFMA